MLFLTVCALSEIFVNRRVVGDANPYKIHRYTESVGDDVLGVPFLSSG